MIVAELHYLLNTFKFMKLFHQIYHKILADTIEYYIDDLLSKKHLKK